MPELRTGEPVQSYTGLLRMCQPQNRQIAPGAGKQAKARVSSVLRRLSVADNAELRLHGPLAVALPVLLLYLAHQPDVLFHLEVVHPDINEVRTVFEGQREPILRLHAPGAKHLEGYPGFVNSLHQRCYVTRVL